MSLHLPILKKLAYSAATLILPLTSAQAFEANLVVERLKAVLAEQGINVDWSGMSSSGSQIILQGTNLKVAKEPQPLGIGTVTLDDVSDANGGYRIGKITLPPYSLSEGGVSFDVSAAELKGLTIPPVGSTDTFASLMMYEGIDLAAISVKKANVPVFGLTKLHVEMTPPKDGDALEFTGSAEKFTVDLASAIEDPKGKATIDALGYNTIFGDFEMSGSWQPSDGRLELSQFDMTVDDAGTLGTTYEVGGYTVEFVKSLQELQKKMADQPAGADDSAQGMAILGLMQQLTFQAASIRFDDDTLTEKLLEHYAKQNGVKPADLANQAKAILPFLLGQLDNPELATEVSEAVSDYLDNPSSFEITAAPEKPVPFALIMAGAMQSPKDLTKTLAVSVTANED
ncbi:hypothetical protein GA830_11880 [Mesorhizobium sp. NBSH29]|uniref:hypothetical protein n=1 Tax=Mesorhizobium sp. NBSH29 TaxID=2654249 RepID=UPI001896526D|nr:hypothetical protein [Mesorhizobium sp. NBSH29]QPC87361.1 hypothetical protein GA830_11880 [Mesorhizobium sp. NBSH29]